MRIAICDSDRKYVKILKNMLYNYSNIYKTEFLVEEFSSGEELLKSKNRYCLIFTEYNLCGINGLETAIKLREKNDKTDIIFLSNNTEFVFDAFKVSPYRFLKKPLSQTELFSVLTELFNNKIQNHPLLITNKFNTYCLNTKDIVYLEANNKHCYIHLHNEIIECNKTMAKIQSILPEKYFIKINRAFIVNLNCICKYNNQYVSLSNNEQVHISRNYLKYFKQEFINFTNPKIP